MDEVNILKKFKIIGCVIYLLIIAIFMTFTILQYLDRRELFNITIIMEKYQYVDRIVITWDSEQIEITSEKYNFREVKNLLYPFYTGRIGVPRSTKMTLQIQSYKQDAEIIYYVGDEKLFAVNVFNFESPPFSENSIFVRNIFMMNNYFSVIFINNGNFLGSFSFDDFDIQTL